MYLYMGHDNVRWRWPTKKYSRCWRTTCWVLYYINSWHFIFTIWSLDWKLKSCGVKIQINFEFKYFQTKAFKVSDFVFDPSECYWSHQDPKLWELFLPLACSALCLVRFLAHLQLEWLQARCLLCVFYGFAWLRDRIKSQLLSVNNG